MKTINAVITKTTLSIEEYYALTLSLELKLQNGGGICFGGYKLTDSVQYV